MSDYDDYDEYDFDSYDEKPKRKRKNDELAPEKDYLPDAILTMVLYWIFWVAGMFYNVYILRQARERQELGEIQHNTGCLRTLLIVYVLLPLGGACVMIVLFGGLSLLGEI